MHFAVVELSILILVEFISGNVVEKSLSLSVVGMDGLFEMEQSLIDALLIYADELQMKIDTILSGLAQMRHENSKSIPDREAYVSNPLNSYPLIRRLQSDWVYWELYMSEPFGGDQIKVVQQHLTALPTKRDLEEAVTGMYRLQTTYGLSPIDMTKGLLNGKQYDAHLSSVECFTIGRQLLDEGKYVDAGFWLKLSLDSYEVNQINTAFGFHRLSIQEAYAETLVRQRRYRDAVHIVESALDDDSHNAKLMRTKAEIALVMRIGYERPETHSPLEPTSFERGCRGEFRNRHPKLHCTYNTTTSPFLMLAPLKMEEVLLDPYIVVYHDAISDAEINELKNISSPHLQPGLIYNATAKQTQTYSGRTSKMYEFENNESETIERLDRRVTDMTGYDMYGSELLQLSNYGLGGHLEIHPDFVKLSTSDDPITKDHGDRIATVIFYLSDVDQGGATVFPYLELSVPARKGTAVMWYNLDNRGNGNWRTLHGGCPVLVGSKWIAVKWIHEYTQMFRKPCQIES